MQFFFLVVLQDLHLVKSKFISLLFPNYSQFSVSALRHNDILFVFAIVFFIVGITTVYKGAASQTATFAVSILVAFVPEDWLSVHMVLTVDKRMVKQRQEDGKAEHFDQVWKLSVRIYLSK